MDARRFAEIKPSDVAIGMRMELRELMEFAEKLETHFRPTRPQTRDGKTRLIDAPYKPAKKRLKRLHTWLQRLKLFHPSAHGGVRGRSCFKSAMRHCGANRMVWMRDASDCFPSISLNAFQNELLELGFDPDTARLLTLLCTVRGRIPQGSPTSNDALNLYFYRIDQLMTSFCGTCGLNYTRVADDFVVSGKTFATGEKAIGLIERELKKRGIKINQRKKKKAGFQNKHRIRLVHNICVNSGRGTKLNKEHQRQLVEKAEKYVAFCKSVDACSLESLAQKRNVLRGWLNYGSQAAFQPPRAVRRALEIGDAIVRRKLMRIGLFARNGKWWLASEPSRLAGAWSARACISS